MSKYLGEFCFGFPVLNLTVSFSYLITTWLCMYLLSTFFRKSFFFFFFFFFFLHGTLNCSYMLPDQGTQRSLSTTYKYCPGKECMHRADCFCVSKLVWAHIVHIQVFCLWMAPTIMSSMVTTSNFYQLQVNLRQVSWLSHKLGIRSTTVVQKVLSLIGFLRFIPGIFKNASLHLNGVLNS